MTVSAMPPDAVAAAAATARAWLRVPAGQGAGGPDEAAVAALCGSALALAEAFCGRVLIARTAVEAVAPGDRWRPLTAAPVTAITAVAADDGAALPVDAYAVDIDGAGTGWLRVTRPVGTARVTVRYAVGEAAGWDDLPPPIAQGIAMLVAHLFDQRDAGAAPPAAVAALWRPWRRMPLGAVAPGERPA